VKDNALEERNAILFENPTEIKKFSSDFSFSRTSYYYINSVSQPIINTGEHVEITNFGKIEKCSIKVNGLTVIAGVNDTGKSTTGKVLFSINKAASRYEQDLKEGKRSDILNKIEKLYNKVRQSISRTSDDYSNFIREFNVNTFYKNISNDFLQATLFPPNIDEFFNFKKETLSKIILNKANLDTCINLLDEIKATILSQEDKQEQIKNALSKALFSEFISDITPKGSTKKTQIKYFAGNTNLLDVELEKNIITKLDFSEDLSFKDVVFIETPLLIQMYDLIKQSDTMFDDEDESIFRNRSKVSLHIKDLIIKIENAKYYSNAYENDFDSIDILKNISSIINGGYTFNRENNDLIFTNTNGKKKSYEIKAVNTASGIKSFGIIHLLLQANVLNDRCLLIIDEPENHLHPEWQVKYAEMIIELVKNEIPVIITSHSPYMIQALKFFSEKNQIESKSNYYFAEMKEGESQSNLIDVTNNLNVIFSKLAQPLKDLVWQ
jgi:predicted ATPase